MANAIGEGGPEFEPGSKFWYSDAGADTLGAIVEQASGSSLEDFVIERLLEPLGMEDAYYVGDSDDPRLDRVASLYVGGLGQLDPLLGARRRSPSTPTRGAPRASTARPSTTPGSWPCGWTRACPAMTASSRPRPWSGRSRPTAPMGSLGSDAPYPTRYPDLTAYHGQMALLHMEGEPVEGEPPPGVEPSSSATAGRTAPSPGPGPSVI